MNATRRPSLTSLLLIIGLVAFLIYTIIPKSDSSVPLTINQVADGIKTGKIVRILEEDSTLKITFADGTQGTAMKEANSTLAEQLIQYGVTTAMLSPDKVKLEVAAPNQWLGLVSLLSYIIPFLLLGGMFLWFFRSSRNSGNNASRIVAMSFCEPRSCRLQLSS